MNARVKVMAFSVITAMFILALTAGTAYANCGGSTEYGQVFDKDGVELNEVPTFTITNVNKNESYTNGCWEDCSVVGWYCLGLTMPNPPPDDTCQLRAGDVLKYEISNLDGTQTNLTYHTVTTEEIAGTGILINIYLEAAGINFSKELSAGWNLISLPLTPSNDSTSAVLGGTSTIEYGDVYSYNAASPGWDNVLGGTMDPGKGYFVNVTTAGTWNCSGTAYTQMNVSLEPGLNLVGWLNTTKTIGESEGDALYSIKDKYWYSSLWNAAGHEYKAYNPHAPSVFNDFTEMERGTGYFISAKESGWLNESCS